MVVTPGENRKKSVRPRAGERNSSHRRFANQAEGLARACGAVSDNAVKDL
jgi:hypothetical protein